MEKKCDEERRAIVNSTENSVKNTPEEEADEDEDGEEDEALSLCDLPLIHRSTKENEEDNSIPLKAIEIHENFDFCSVSNESQMCAADEVFYQGQIMPLHRPISSNKVDNRSRSISRSESMDFSSLFSSRSSSIGSHQSSSSSGGSSTSAAADPKLPLRNQFHSHPSPSPRTHLPSNSRGIAGINNRNSGKKSSAAAAWNIFRLGLVASPPEIAFHDLKNRCPGKNRGSRNSCNSSSNNSDKKKISAREFLRGCNCSVDAVDTVPSKVVVIKRSARDGESEFKVEEEKLVAVNSPKKRVSHLRTFEWLKQLSLEGGAVDE